MIFNGPFFLYDTRRWRSRDGERPPDDLIISFRVPIAVEQPPAAVSGSATACCISFHHQTTLIFKSLPALSCDLATHLTN